MQKLLTFVGVVLGSLLLPLSITSAQSCGDFIFQYDYGDGNGPVDERSPIDNCDNPFDADDPEPFTYELILNNQEATTGSTIRVDEGELVPGSLQMSKSSFRSIKPLQLYRQEGEDYRFIAVTETGNFLMSPLTPGEYVAVLTYQQPVGYIGAEKSWYRWLQDLLLPATAHAFTAVISDSEVVVISFTIEYEVPPPPPTGASSVLFLPGIQASRLYTDGVLGTENQLWEPNRNADVEKLTMTATGESVNDVYTRDVLDEINFLPVVQANIYKSFLGILSKLEDEGVIVSSLPFAYDWRYDVFNVATKPIVYPNGEEKLLLEEVKKLAVDSHTGKVTIVAHSNGGLVAKALLHEYGEGELAGLIDKVILVGTPQLGTPKAIGSLLHGLSQHSKLQLVYNQPTSRETTKFMPGAYGLLPSSKFITNNESAIITADNTAIATPVSSYGDLSVYDNLVNFLTDAQSSRNEVVNVSHPIALDTNLLSATIQKQLILDNWIAPDGVEVYEVAGTGLATIKGFYYREFSCKDINPSCILIPFLKPTPIFTTEGDETVVLESATAYEGDKVELIVDLYSESAGLLNNNIKHSNLTESNSVQDFLESVIKYPYLTDTIVASEFSDVSRRYTIIGVHSPVSLQVKNESGQSVGKVAGELKEDIVGSSYFEFADSKYVVVPVDEQISVLLEGEADGRYSLTIEELGENGEQTLRQEVIGATSTAGMTAEFDCIDSTCGEVVVDYDADGERDVVFDWLGNYREREVTTEVVGENSEERVVSQSSGTRVGDRVKPSGVVAGASTSNQQAELLRMWKVLQEIQASIDELKVYYNLS